MNQYFKKIVKPRLVRYMFVGGIATLIDAFIFNYLMEFGGLHYFWALSISFPCGVLVNFTLCTLLVFEHKNHPLWQTLIRHYIANLGGFALNNVFISFLLSVMYVKSFLFARIIAAACTFLLNFIVIKKFVFQNT
ncbi:MAG: GtrA family protein [Candidatus Babeliaceae bacterium]